MTVFSRKLLLLAALPLVLLTQGCATTRSTATTTEAQCSAFRAITYSGANDTPETVRQVRVHNASGRNLKCW